MVVDCLETLVGQLDLNEQVVVVDNESGDNSVEYITTAIEKNGWGSCVRVIEAGGNNGFSAGNNVGIQAVDAKAYLLLNSDTLVRSKAMQSLREALVAHPEVSMFGPRLEWESGEPQVSTFRDPSPLSEFDRAARTGFLSRILKRWAVAPPLPSSPTPFLWASFAAILIRRQVFETVGLMDEGYFLYFEDIDFCRRARLAGFPGLYWPSARVVHLRGGSGPVKEQMASRGRPPSYYYVSRSRFFAKAFGRKGLFAANLMWILGRSISLLREVAFHKKPHLCEKEGRDLWHNFKTPVDPPQHWRGTFPPQS
jgi:GT2 family glycosyltransferase